MQYKEHITSICNHLALMAFFMLEHIYFHVPSFTYCIFICQKNIIVRDLTVEINRAQVSKA